MDSQISDPMKPSFGPGKSRLVWNLVTLEQAPSAAEKMALLPEIHDHFSSPTMSFHFHVHAVQKVQNAAVGMIARIRSRVGCVGDRLSVRTCEEISARKSGEITACMSARFRLSPSIKHTPKPLPHPFTLF